MLFKVTQLYEVNGGQIKHTTGLSEPYDLAMTSKAICTAVIWGLHSIRQLASQKATRF